MWSIDKQARAPGVAPKDIMSQVNANTCYPKGECVIKEIVPLVTPQNRPRNIARIKWGVVVV